MTGTTAETLPIGMEARLPALFSNSGHTLNHLVMTLYATAVLYMPSEFGLPYGEMLGLASIGLVLYGVAALPAGWLGDRWSQIGMMIVLFIGCGFALILIGTANGVFQLTLGLSLLGFFAAIYHPVGIPWLVANAKRQGMTLGLNGFFGGLGGALAAPFVGLMIDYFSWRYAFLIPGIASMIIGAGMIVAWIRGQIADAKADRAPTAAPQAGAIKRAFLVLTLTMTCSGFIYSGMMHTMPKLFENGLSPALATSYTEIGLFVGIVVGFSSLSSVMGGWLADRFSPRKIYILFWLLQVPPLLFITTMIDHGLIALMAVVVVFSTSYAAAENILVTRYTPFGWRGIAFGAKFVLALGIGGLTVHVAGKMFDATGNFDLLYVCLGIAAGLAFLGALFLPKREPVKI